MEHLERTYKIQSIKKLTWNHHGDLERSRGGWLEARRVEDGVEKGFGGDGIRPYATKLLIHATWNYIYHWVITCELTCHIKLDLPLKYNMWVLASWSYNVIALALGAQPNVPDNDYNQWHGYTQTHNVILITHKWLNYTYKDAIWNGPHSEPQLKYWAEGIYFIAFPP